MDNNNNDNRNNSNNNSVPNARPVHFTPLKQLKTTHKLLYIKNINIQTCQTESQLFNILHNSVPQMVQTIQQQTIHTRITQNNKTFVLVFRNNCNSQTIQQWANQLNQANIQQIGNNYQAFLYSKQYYSQQAEQKQLTTNKVLIKGLYNENINSVTQNLTTIGFTPTKVEKWEKVRFYQIELPTPQQARQLVQTQLFFGTQKPTVELFKETKRITSRKPIRCTNCQKFGHKTRDCIGESKCTFCTSSEHKAINCPHKKHKNKWKCSNCKGKHTSNSWKCPKFITLCKKIGYIIPQQRNQQNQLRQNIRQSRRNNVPYAQMASHNNQQVNQSEQQSNNNNNNHNNNKKYQRVQQQHQSKQQSNNNSNNNNNNKNDCQNIEQQQQQIHEHNNGNNNQLNDEECESDSDVDIEVNGNARKKRRLNNKQSQSETQQLQQQLHKEQTQNKHLTNQLKKQQKINNDLKQQMAQLQQQMQNMMKTINDLQNQSQKPKPKRILTRSQTKNQTKQTENQNQKHNKNQGQKSKQKPPKRRQSRRNSITMETEEKRNKSKQQRESQLDLLSISNEHTDVNKGQSQQ